MTTAKTAAITCLAVIILWGGFLRLYKLGDQSFWMDEAISVLHAQAIVDHGYPLLENSRISLESLPTHYLMALGINLCPDIHWGGRLLQALAGIIVLPLFFVLSRYLYQDSKSALLTTALMALMTYEIAWSRQARMYAFLQFFMVTSLVAFHCFLNGSGRRYLLMAGVCALLAVLSHRAGYLVVLMLALMIGTSGFGRLKQGIGCLRRQSKWVFVGVGVFVGGFILLLLMADNTSSLVATINNVFGSSRTGYAHQYFSFLKHQFGPFLWLALIGGLLFLARNWQMAVPLVLGAGMFFATISWKTYLFAFRYSFPLFFILILLAGYCFKVAFDWFPTPNKWFRGMVAAGLISGFAFCLHAAEITVIPRGYYLLGYTEPQPDWRKGFQTISKQYTAQFSNDLGLSELNVVTTLPMFHDLYLGKATGHKFYLPLSFTGYPGDVQLAPAYTTARVINNLEQLKAIDGYVILDDFSFNMLVNQDIQTYLSITTSREVVHGKFPLCIWRINPQSAVRGPREMKFGPYR